MVQILPNRQVPTSEQRFNKVLEMGSQLAGGYLKKKELQQNMQQENEAARRMGIDLSGISDPDTRKKAFEYAMQGENQRKLEQQKTAGRQGLQQEKQDYLSKLFGGGQQGGQNDQQQPGQQQGQQFDPALIPDEAIARATAIDPALGRTLQQQKDVALREKRQKQEFELKQEKASPEYQRQHKISEAQAQADVKYNQELQASEKQHKLKTQTLDRLDQLNKKGVTGKPYEKLLEKSGLINLTSEGRREFAADVKNLITDIRSILGGQFSTFEFQTILNAYPSADFSKGANEAIIKNLKEFQDIRGKEFEFANQIKKENKGKLPEDFQARVNEMVSQYAQSKLPDIKANNQKIMAEEYGITAGNILLLDPQGEPLDVSPDQVEQYLSLGATLP